MSEHMMARSTLSASPSNTEVGQASWPVSPCLAVPAVIFALLASGAWAQLPDGPGREELGKLCKGCHELEKAISVRQDRDAWGATMDKMRGLGVKGADQELRAILEYLVKHFPAEELPRLNVNKATAIEFESRLSLPRSQSAAIIRHRNENGPFRSIEDLKKVPGVDAARIEAKKERLTF